LGKRGNRRAVRKKNGTARQRLTGLSGRSMVSAKKVTCKGTGEKKLAEQLNMEGRPKKQRGMNEGKRITKPKKGNFEREGRVRIVGTRETPRKMGSRQWGTCNGIRVRKSTKLKGIEG